MGYNNRSLEHIIKRIIVVVRVWLRMEKVIVRSHALKLFEFFIQHLCIDFIQAVPIISKRIQIGYVPFTVEINILIAVV